MSDSFVVKLVLVKIMKKPLHSQGWISSGNFVGASILGCVVLTKFS